MHNPTAGRPASAYAHACAGSMHITRMRISHAAHIACSAAHKICSSDRRDPASLIVRKPQKILNMDIVHKYIRIIIITSTVCVNKGV